MVIDFWTKGLNPITCYKTSREINRTPERMELGTISLNAKINKKVPKPTKTKVAEYSGPTKGEHPNAVKVIVEDNFQQKIPFKSAVEAAAYLKIKPAQLYNILRGKKKNTTNFKIYKS